MVKYVLFLFAAVFLMVPAAYASECLMCHGAMHGRMESAKGVVEVHVDAGRFEASVHGVLDCTACHLGFTSGPHSASGEVPDDVAALARKVSVKKTADPVAMSACSQCHPDIYKEYMDSVHGKNIFEMKQADGPLCTDCHGSPHYIVPRVNPESPVSFEKVVETCGRCHEDKPLMAKYNISADVVEMYKASFHGKKYELGHKKVPVCNTCHGSHSIMLVDAAGSPVVGKGKIETCGKCHAGATAKFAAAPAHTHVGKDNPIPYYSAKGLTALVIGTFLFIFMHVILDMYAETRDRLSGRKKGGH